MDPLTLLTLATTAYGGYRGYRQSKDAGASGIGRLLGTAAGAYGGYTLGKTGGQMFGVPGSAPQLPFTGGRNPMAQFGTQAATEAAAKQAVEKQGLEKLKQALLMKGDTDKYDPLKISALIAAGTYFGGAFDQGPVDMYQPTYNLAYADFAKQRPGYHT